MTLLAIATLLLNGLPVLPGLPGVTGVTGTLLSPAPVAAAAATGAPLAWGRNDYGQLGDGTATWRTAPVRVSGLSDVTAVAGSTYHSLALKGDGTVWAWGSNDYGQLGDGTTTQQTTPVQVKGPNNQGFLTGVTAIAAGGYHSLVLKSDGTVWAWGYNRYSQLGDGTGNTWPFPVQVSGPNNQGFLTGVTAIAAGDFHSLALKSDGTVWAWGYNYYGQLGDGTSTQQTSPVQVKGPNNQGFLTGVTAISAGNYHSLALKGDGTIWAWGYNDYGVLGDGTSTQQTTPVQVSGLTGVTAIVAGGYHSLALESDGTIWGWGYNGYGALGDGTTVARTTPVQVSGLSGVTAVAAARGDGGGYHSLALKSDGTVWAWGSNVSGQLGGGRTGVRTTPLQVSGLSGVIAIAGGMDHSLAITGASDTTPPTITGSRSPAANSSGWNNTSVTVSFTCADEAGGSGLKTCSGPTTLTNEGGNQSVPGTATDNADNSASATVSNINIDKTAPTLGGAPTTAANALGWYNGDVTIQWTCADQGGLSGVASCPSQYKFNQNGANQSYTATASDAAGNSASTTVSNINIDKAAPTVRGAATTAPNAKGWYNGPVTIHFTCADQTGLSGIDPNGGCPADVVLAKDGANQSVTRTATDRAGNTASFTVSGINIDRTAPVISVMSGRTLLWPADHRYVTLNVSSFVRGVQDNLDNTLIASSVTISKVWSDEPESTSRSGNTLQDIIIAPDGRSVQLRAERENGGNGRVYTITVRITDRAGNTGYATYQAHTPPSQGTQNSIDDGPSAGYTVNRP
jgi:alpha-tubulin suppressor-like RCC1 family protein